MGAAINKEMVDHALYAEAKELDASDTNRSNVKFSYLSQKIATAMLASKPTLESLEAQYETQATAWKSGEKPPFCVVEGVKYAIDATKFAAIEEPGHVCVCVPFSPSSRASKKHRLRAGI